MVKHKTLVSQTNTISIEMSEDKLNIKHIQVAIPENIIYSAYFPIKAKHSFSNNTSEVLIGGYIDKSGRESSDNACAPEQHFVRVSQANVVHSTSNTGGDFKSSYGSTPTSPTSLQLPVINYLTD